MRGASHGLAVLAALLLVAREPHAPVHALHVSLRHLSQGGMNLDGTAGNDTLMGGPSNDTISGGAGNDNITGRPSRGAVASPSASAAQTLSSATSVLLIALRTAEVY